MLGMDKLKKIFKLYYILLLELFYCDGFRFFFSILNYLVNCLGSKAHYIFMPFGCCVLTSTLYILKKNFLYYPPVHT